VTTWGEHTAEHHTGSRKSLQARKTMEAFANLREELFRERALKADLLAALQEAIRAAESSDEWRTRHASWLNTARAVIAIAKAEGR